MNRPARRKWLFNIATLFSAAGIAFLAIEEFNMYKTFAIAMLAVGIILFVISKIYRKVN